MLYVYSRKNFEVKREKKFITLSCAKQTHGNFITWPCAWIQALDKRVILPCVMYLPCVLLSCKRAKNVYAMCALFDVYLIIVSYKQNLSHVADIRHTTKM